MEEALVATFVAQKFFTEQIQLKTIESMQTLDAEVFVNEIENEINGILSAMVSNVKVPRRSMSFTDFFKPPVAPSSNYENEDQENVHHGSVYRPPMMHSANSSRSSTPRAGLPRDPQRRMTVGGSTNMQIAPPIPPKKLTAGSRSAPQSPRRNVINNSSTTINVAKSTSNAISNKDEVNYDSSSSTEDEVFENNLLLLHVDFNNSCDSIGKR